MNPVGALVDERRSRERPHTPARTDFWPPRERYGVSRLELASLCTASENPQLPPLVDRLTALADATWALHRGGVDSAGAEAELVAAGADTLRLLGRALGGELEASLDRRGEAVLCRDWDANARLTAACDDHRLIVLYGPLHTWSNKGDGFGFSSAVGLRHDELDGFVRNAEPDLFAAASAVGTECGGRPFELLHVPAFVITDLVGCGGEADTFPKHFAYFMPEDGRVATRDKTMTVVFLNVYVQQYLQVSAPIGEIVCPQWRGIDPWRVERGLLTWLRGHDISHFLSEGGPVPDHLVGWPGALRGALQEAFADVMGFLLATTPSVIASTRLTSDDLSEAFIGEMLRYFRRGASWFPDSCAAQLELVYLVEGGWLDIELRAGRAPRMKWDGEALRKGMQALGEELVQSLLRGDEGAKSRLRSHCVDPRPGWLSDFDAGLRAMTAHVPDGLYYTFLP